LDSLPPAPPAYYATAPGDIYPTGERERELCASASHPDWLYLGALAALDTGAIWLGSSETIKYSSRMPVRFTGPAMIGLTWGATIGGGWLALPKCSSGFVGETPREGTLRASWPLALALALLAGATAPVVNGIAIGNDLPNQWSNLEREMHVVTAAVAGFGGALFPYLVPPRTWAAALELDHVRVGPDGRGGAFIGYAVSF
jgi:hypothetical protein